MKQKLVTQQVIKDFRARTALGLKKYGRKLTTWDGRSSIIDRYEEILDEAQYTRKMITELEDMNKLSPHKLKIAFSAFIRNHVARPKNRR